MTDEFNTLVIRIIKKQESIIGPLAVEQAQKIQGLNLNWHDQKITINGSKKNILENLVKKYEIIFGEASLEVCREIVHSMSSKIPADQIPSLLQ